ncbi:MAG TPA: DUF2726 domain-containing protein [Candidatus Limnocylindria bacterium]|jgi:hypothetical protein
MAKQTLPASDEAFATALKAAAGTRFAIRSKTSLAEVCAMARVTPRYPAKILSERVDFVLCDRATLAPVVAIDLDDARHLVRERSVRESIIDEVFRAIGVALIRPRAQLSYEPDAIAQWIDAVVSRVVAKTVTRTTERPAH